MTGHLDSKTTHHSGNIPACTARPPEALSPRSYHPLPSLSMSQTSIAFRETPRPLCFLPFVLQRDTPLAPPGQPRHISLLVAPCPLLLGGCRRRRSPAPKNKHEVNTFCSSMILSSAYCRGLWHIAHLPPPAHFRY